MKDQTQPTLRGGREGGHFQSGSKRSICRLDDLRFDPIRELVEKYRRLEGELDYQEDVRANKIVPLTSTGKVRAYNAETHMVVYDKLLNTAEKLLRYYYGRVPETTIVEEKKASPLVVNLTRDGETYTIGKNIMENEYED